MQLYLKIVLVFFEGPIYPVINHDVMFFYRWMTLMLDWIFPRICLGCRKEGAFLCDNCFVRIQTKRFQVCPICKKTSYQGRVHKNSCSSHTQLDGLIVVALYHENPFLEKAIKQFKYKYSSELSEKLGLLMTKILRENVMTDKDKVLVPIPLHTKREKWRGYNQSDLLAQVIQKYTGQIFYPLLQRVRATRQQAKLTKQERVENMKNAFALISQPDGVSQLVGLKIVLIDDVSSTLATLEEAAKVLKKKGIREVYGAVLARG
jgi:ComF family protein